MGKSKDLSPEAFLQLLKETKLEVETRYPPGLHPVFVRHPEYLAQELERRAKGYSLDFQYILRTAAHFVRLAAHD